MSVGVARERGEAAAPMTKSFALRDGSLGVRGAGMDGGFGGALGYAEMTGIVTAQQTPQVNARVRARTRSVIQYGCDQVGSDGDSDNGDDGDKRPSAGLQQGRRRPRRTETPPTPAHGERLRDWGSLRRWTRAYATSRGSRVDF